MHTTDSRGSIGPSFGARLGAELAGKPLSPGASHSVSTRSTTVTTSQSELARLLTLPTHQRPVQTPPPPTGPMSPTAAVVLIVFIGVIVGIVVWGIVAGAAIQSGIVPRNTVSVPLGVLLLAFAFLGGIVAFRPANRHFRNPDSLTSYQQAREQAQSRKDRAKQAADRAKEAAAESFHRAQGRWNAAYYCQRDDVVFVAGEPLAVPPTQFADLLWAGS